MTKKQTPEKQVVTLGCTLKVFNALRVLEHHGVISQQCITIRTAFSSGFADESEIRVLIKYS
ncbi:MAG: hypothetical protein HRT83_03020 [Hyphomicrobiaceae bacterium]|nr:hypothetical protein [Hyphomicrobiaceae bacterium]